MSRREETSDSLHNAEDCREPDVMSNSRHFFRSVVDSPAVASSDTSPVAGGLHLSDSSGYTSGAAATADSPMPIVPSPLPSANNSRLSSTISPCLDPIEPDVGGDDELFTISMEDISVDHQPFNSYFSYPPVRPHPRQQVSSPVGNFGASPPSSALRPTGRRMDTSSVETMVSWTTTTSQVTIMSGELRAERTDSVWAPVVSGAGDAAVTAPIAEEEVAGASFSLFARPRSAPMQMFHGIVEEDETDSEDLQFPECHTPISDLFGFTIDDEPLVQSTSTRPIRVPAGSTNSSANHRPMVQSRTEVMLERRDSQLMPDVVQTPRCQSVPTLSLQQERAVNSVALQLRTIGDDLYSGSLSRTSSRSRMNYSRTSNEFTSHSADSGNGFLSSLRFLFAPTPQSASRVGHHGDRAVGGAEGGEEVRSRRNSVPARVSNLIQSPAVSLLNMLERFNPFTGSGVDDEGVFDDN